MEKMEKKIQEVVFDVEVQYCDPSDCYHDCKHDFQKFCEKQKGHLEKLLWGN